LILIHYTTQDATWRRRADASALAKAAPQRRESNLNGGQTALTLAGRARGLTPRFKKMAPKRPPIGANVLI
jgi:hypothetical protein